MKKKFKYSGMELDFFEQATNWKNYYLKLCSKFFGKNKSVLEVGAGIGGISKFFIPNTKFANWTLIEPDPINFKTLLKNIKFKKIYDIKSFNLDINAFLEKSGSFDLILIADVLEHLENDQEILYKLFDKLNSSGKIIIFVPACQYLYSAFDIQIGHYRRYNFMTLNKIMPPNCKIIEKKYIDSIGFFASLFNKLILKSPNPTKKQVLFWDRVLLPISIIFDKFIDFKFGKNIYLTISKES